MNTRGAVLTIVTFMSSIPVWAGVTMDIEVHEITTDALGTDILWRRVDLPNTWVLAEHYLRVNPTFTADVRGGIQVYTDNTAGDAVPYQVTQVTPVTGWLVDGITKKTGLPFAWLIKDVREAPATFTPDWGFWFYMKDKAQTSFLNGETYITPINDFCQTQGTPCFQWDNGQYASNGRLPFFMYFEADFSNAVTPRTYSTPTLRIEAYSL
jgi:hypothetical protein